MSKRHQVGNTWRSAARVLVVAWAGLSHGASRLPRAEAKQPVSSGLDQRIVALGPRLNPAILPAARRVIIGETPEHAVVKTPAEAHRMHDFVTDCRQHLNALADRPGTSSIETQRTVHAIADGLQALRIHGSMERAGVRAVRREDGRVVVTRLGTAADLDAIRRAYHHAKQALLELPQVTEAGPSYAPILMEGVLACTSDAEIVRLAQKVDTALPGIAHALAKDDRALSRRALMLGLKVILRTEANRTVRSVRPLPHDVESTIHNETDLDNKPVVAILRPYYAHESSAAAHQRLVDKNPQYRWHFEEYGRWYNDEAPSTIPMYTHYLRGLPDSAMKEVNGLKQPFLLALLNQAPFWGPGLLGAEYVESFAQAVRTHVTPTWLEQHVMDRGHVRDFFAQWMLHLHTTLEARLVEPQFRNGPREREFVPEQDLASAGIHATALARDIGEILVDRPMTRLYGRMHQSFVNINRLLDGNTRVGLSDVWASPPPLTDGG